MDYKKDDAYKISDEYYTVSLIDGEDKGDHYTIEPNSKILKDDISGVKTDKDELIFIDGRGDFDLNRKLHESIFHQNKETDNQSLSLDTDRKDNDCGNKSSINGYYGKRKDRSKKIKQFEISNSIHQHQVKSLFDDLDDGIANNQSNTSKVNRTNNSTNSKTRYYVNTRPKDEAIPYIFKIVIALFLIGLTFEIFLSMVEEVPLFIKG